MAVAYSATQWTGASNTTVTLTRPSCSAGDLLIMHAWCNAGALTTPSGWTKLVDLLLGPFSAPRCYVFWKLAGSSEPSTYTLTGSSNSYNEAGISVFTGADGTTPINAVTSATSGGATTTVCPSVTSTVANVLILHLWAMQFSTSGTPPGGETSRYQHLDSGGNGMLFVAATVAQAVAGASATSTLTPSPAPSTNNIMATIALAPVAAGPPPVADFTGTPTSGTEPLSVAFTDTSTNTPTSWSWTFGDGGTSTAQNPTHSYTTAGTYTVALVATNSGGSNTKTRTGYVTVSDQPRPIRINTSQGWVDIADATSFVSGSGTPTAAVGATGAVYLNTATGLLYGPKAGGAWPGTPITVPAGTVADATTSSKGIVQLAGDLAGTAASPQIAALAVTDAEVAAANKDGTAATPSLRTLGTGSTQAAAGNDARFGGTAITYGTSPPGSPVDGQLWMLPADATNGVVWMFRYNASAGTYKWEFVGGAPLRGENTNAVSVSTTGFAVVGPQLTVPRAGDYDWAVFGEPSIAAGVSAHVGVQIGAATVTEATDTASLYTPSSNAVAVVSRSKRVTGVAASTAFTVVANTNSGTWTILQRGLTVLPIRVS